MKSKTPIIVVGVIVLAAAAFFATQKSKSEEAYQTFALALDHLAGPGNWSAQSHQAGMFDGLLTVTGVKINLSAPTPAEPADQAEKNPAEAADKAEADKNEPADHEAAAALPNPLAGALEIATVEIKNGLDKKSLEALLAAADWRDQKELKLADRLVLKGVRHTFLNGTPEGEILRPDEVRLEEAVWESVSLAASGAEAPAGKAGFIKALRVGNFSYKNVKAVLKNDTMAMEFAADLAKVEGLDFTAEPLPGLETLDPSGLASVLSGLTVKKAVVQNVALDFAETEGQMKLAFKIAGAEKKDVAGFGRVGEVDVKGLLLEVTEPKSDMAITATLDHLNFTGFDFSDYMRKMMPAVALAATDPGRAEEAMGRAQTLADFFVMPFSLDQGVMSGLEMKLGDFMTIQMAEAAIEGPYKAGEIPAKQKSQAKGLVVILPEDPQAADGSEPARELYTFGRDFGMTRFEIDATGEGDYDPETGAWAFRTNQLAIKDLADSTYALELGGMTAERLDTLKGIPLASAFMAMLAPEAVLGDLSLNHLNFKVVDRGLTDRIFKYIVAAGGEEMKGVSPEALQTAAASNVEILMDIRGREFLANPEVLAQSLAAFLKKPGELELDLTAEPPLNFKSVRAAAGDVNKILNSLNITVKANGDSAPALKFNIAGFSPSQPPSPDMEDDERDEE